MNLLDRVLKVLPHNQHSITDCVSFDARAGKAKSGTDKERAEGSWSWLGVGWDAIKQLLNA